MTNAELITELTYYACIEKRKLLSDAADALEAAERLLDQNTQRCEALRKQLRESHEDYEKHINELTTKCNQLQAAVDNYEKRIAELMPKEGEWIEKWRFKTDGTPFHKIGDMECSVCHGDMLGRFYSKYCPHCGALLRGEHDGET